MTYSIEDLNKISEQYENILTDLECIIFDRYRFLEVDPPNFSAISYKVNKDGKISVELFDFSVEDFVVHPVSIDALNGYLSDSDEYETYLKLREKYDGGTRWPEEV